MKKCLLTALITASFFSPATFAIVYKGTISNKTKATFDLNIVHPAILENSLKFPDIVTTETLGETIGKGAVTVKNGGPAARLAVAMGPVQGAFKAYAKGHEGDEKYVLYYATVKIDKPGDTFRDTDYFYWMTDDPQTNVNYEVMFGDKDSVDNKPKDVQPGIYPITTIAAVYTP